MPVLVDDLLKTSYLHIFYGRDDLPFAMVRSESFYPRVTPPRDRFLDYLTYTTPNLSPRIWKLDEIVYFELVI